MDTRLAVVLVTVLCQVYGYPQAVQDADDTLKARLISLESEGTDKLKTPLTSLDGKLKAAERLLDDRKLPTSSKEEEDAVRSTRQSPSPPFHQMSFGKGPHLTTVCIQVFSDHHPKVVCGPQIGEKEEKLSPPPAARFSSPYSYGRVGAEPYPMRIIPSSAASPAHSSSYPLRRTEEESHPRPMDPTFQPASGFAPAQSSQPPLRIIPSSPVSPVYAQRPYYQPVNSGGLISPALMRLNCAVQPDGHLALRGGALGYPYTEDFIALQDGSPARFGPNVVSPPAMRTQNPFALPQGRSAAEEEQMYLLGADMLGSPLGAWSYGESVPAESMMQGRSANGGYLGYSGIGSSSDDFARREYLQLQALRESKERLEDIQSQLAALREVEEQKQSAVNSSSPDLSSDSSATVQVADLKEQPAKHHGSSKRHTRI